MNSGVYTITNEENGHRYVGSTVNIKRRLRNHKSALLRGGHRNPHLQNAWNLYGEDAFEFEVLERWEPEFLVSMEQLWMNRLQPEYNILSVAGSSLGMMLSDETKRKMSVAQMGKELSEGHRANISASMMGRKCGPMSAEHRAKIASAQMGNTNPLGYRHTDKARKNMADARIGNTNILGHSPTPETRAKLSAAKKGKPWSPARRAAQEARKARKEND